VNDHYNFVLNVSAHQTRAEPRGPYLSWLIKLTSACKSTYMNLIMECNDSTGVASKVGMSLTHSEARQLRDALIEAYSFEAKASFIDWKTVRIGDEVDVRCAVTALRHKDFLVEIDLGTVKPVIKRIVTHHPQAELKVGGKAYLKNVNQYEYTVRLLNEMQVVLSDENGFICVYDVAAVRAVA